MPFLFGGTRPFLSGWMPCLLLVGGEEQTCDLGWVLQMQSSGGGVLAQVYPLKDDFYAFWVFTLPSVFVLAHFQAGYSALLLCSALLSPRLLSPPLTLFLSVFLYSSWYLFKNLLSISQFAFYCLNLRTLCGRRNVWLGTGTNICLVIYILTRFLLAFTKTLILPLSSLWFYTNKHVHLSSVGIRFPNLWNRDDDFWYLLCWPVLQTCKIKSLRVCACACVRT